MNFPEKVAAVEKQLDEALSNYHEVYDGEAFPPASRNVDYWDGATDVLALAVATLRETSTAVELNRSRDRIAAADRSVAAEAVAAC